MSTTADRIARIEVAVGDATLGVDDAIAQLAGVTQHRGGIDARRRDGAFFTEADVAAWLARRAICAAVLERGGLEVDRIDAALAEGNDLRALVLEHAGVHAARAQMSAWVCSLRVLDPSCGAGVFLLAAWNELRDVAALLGSEPPSLGQLHGVDIDEDALAACRLTLAIAAPGAAGVADLRQANAEHAGALPCADVIIGNPPYVRAAASAEHAQLVTRSVPNRSAWIVERALEVAAPAARVAFVLPISTVCTDAFADARRSWSKACDRIFASHFDTIPCSLFDGVVQRISILEGRRRDPDAAHRDAPEGQWWTTRYQRWRRDERAGLLDAVRFVPLMHVDSGRSLPKVGTTLELDLLTKLAEHPPALRLLRSAASDATQVVHYKRRWSYFLLFMDFVPGIWDEQGRPREPSEFKTLHVDAAFGALPLLAIYSSTLFWWYFSVFTDNRNVNRRDLESFPVPELDAAALARLETLGDELMVALRGCAEVRECTYRSIGTIRNTYFRQGATRHVLDRIDVELARAYGLDDEQLQFVLGFERRFRGGDARDA